MLADQTNRKCFYRYVKKRGHPGDTLCPGDCLPGSDYCAAHVAAGNGMCAVQRCHHSRDSLRVQVDGDTEATYMLRHALCEKHLVAFYRRYPSTRKLGYSGNCESKLLKFLEDGG